MYTIKRFIKSLVLPILTLIKLPFKKRYYAAESYFPELASRQKSLTKRFIDQCRYTIKFGSPNEFYFLYGLDIKGFQEKSDFVDYPLFMRRRNEMNYRLTWTPPVPVLRDKALFGIVAEAYGFKTPKNIGIIKDGSIFLFDERVSIPLSSFLSRDIFCEGNICFIKKIDGECADGVLRVTLQRGVIFHEGKSLNFDSLFEKKTRYILQKAIENQHSALSLINPKTINTIRLVTVHNRYTDEIEVFSCVLRVGRSNKDVDNWAVGGLSIGIDTEKGELRKYGFFKPGFGLKAAEHPDTHIIFEGYKIPFINEVISQAKSFHHFLYGMHSIGWDIAITSEGPCFIEGNDNWEISLMQISNHGLQKEFDRLFY